MILHFLLTIATAFVGIVSIDARLVWFVVLTLCAFVALPLVIGWAWRGQE